MILGDQRSILPACVFRPGWVDACVAAGVVVVVARLSTLCVHCAVVKLTIQAGLVTKRPGLRVGNGVRSASSFDTAAMMPIKNVAFGKGHFKFVRLGEGFVCPTVSIGTSMIMVIFVPVLKPSKALNFRKGQPGVAVALCYLNSLGYDGRRVVGLPFTCRPDIIDVAGCFIPVGSNLAAEKTAY